MITEVIAMLGDLIRESRKKMGYTQKQLGLLCGYNETSAERVVQYWEGNKREVPLSKVRALAKVLEIPLDSLIP